MEVRHGGVVKTRAINVSSSDGFLKRRKIDSPEPLLSSSSSSGSQLYRESVIHCSPDLKLESLETEISMFASSGFRSREPSSSIEFYGNSASEMESSSLKRNKPSPSVSGGKPAATMAAKMPLTAEIEEFFSVAEKYERKRFADK